MKKIYTLFFSLVLCISYKAQTPNFVWAKNIGGTSTERGICIVSDALDNVYSAINLQGTADFDPGAGSFTLTALNSDAVISKLNSSGNFVWAKQLKASGASGSCEINSICIDVAGNIVTTGNLYGTADFDPGAGVFNLTATAQAMFVCKLDPSGNLIWAKILNGTSTSGFNYAWGVSTDSNNNVYSTGTFTGTVDFDPSASVFNLTSVGGNADVYISKLDVNGNFVWAKQIGSTFFERSQGITIDNSSNVYITGLFQGTLDFDPSASIYTITPTGTQETFIAKYDVAGNFVWVKNFAELTAGGNAGVAIIYDPIGQIILTGAISGTADFDPSAGTFTISVSSQSSYIVKLDLAGNFVWAKTISGSTTMNVYSIARDPMGNIFTIGQFAGTCDFDPGIGVVTANSLSSGSNTDIYVNALNSNGNFLWYSLIGGGSGSRGQGISATNSGYIYLTGFHTGTNDFDPGVGTYTIISTSGSNDAPVIKLTACSGFPSSLGSISGSSNLCAGISTTSYSISSVSGALSYSWSLPAGWSGSSTTNSISATTGTTSGNISVTASNACGTSSASVLSVTVNPLPTITANTSSSVICGPPYQGTANISASGASTYTWNTSATTASISVSPSVTTTYTVTGTSTAGCTNTATITQSVSACTGISQPSTLNSQLTVFPNPFSTGITILSGGEKQTIAIYNTLGELVHTEIIEQEKTEIDLHKLPSGLYFIKSDLSIQKLIKE